MPYIYKHNKYTLADIGKSITNIKMNLINSSVMTETFFTYSKSVL